MLGLPSCGWSAPAADGQSSHHSGCDGYTSSAFVAAPGWDELVAYLNRWNGEWVQAACRLSPRLLIELLGFGGERTAADFRSLDPLALGPTVSWAGPDPAPTWLHIAREYTERWTHQEQIREAVGAPGLRRPRLFRPVLDTFLRALLRTYRDLCAPAGTHLRLVIAGDAGGAWSLVRCDGRWGLFEEVGADPTSITTLDQDNAWRLFTRGIVRDAARSRITVAGDDDLAALSSTRSPSSPSAEATRSRHRACG